MKTATRPSSSRAGSRVTRVGTLVFSLALLSGASSAAAQAERRASVLEFSGRGAGVVRGAVVSAVSDQVELVPEAQVRQTARRLGVDTSAEGLSRIAAELGVSVFVRGAVTGRGNRRTAAIEIVGHDGVAVASGEVRVRRGRRARRRFDSEVQALMGQAFAELDRRAVEMRELEAEVEQQEIDELGEDLGEEDDEPRELTPVPLIEAMLGLGVRTRDAEIVLADGATRVYDVGLFPEISLRLTARPFASSEGGTRGIFATLELAHSLALATELDDGTELGTSAFRFGIDAGYLAQVGPAELGGSLGVGYDSFSLDENTVMASTRYTYLRWALLGRLPLMEQSLYAQLDAGFRTALGTGDLAPMFGSSASAIGFDIAASLGGSLDMGLAYAFRLAYVGYSLSFEGDGTVMADTAVDGSDGAIIVTVNAGWQLR